MAYFNPNRSELRLIEEIETESENLQRVKGLPPDGTINWDLQVTQAFVNSAWRDLEAEHKDTVDWLESPERERIERDVVTTLKRQ